MCKWIVLVLFLFYEATRLCKNGGVILLKYQFALYQNVATSNTTLK